MELLDEVKRELLADSPDQNSNIQCPQSASPGKNEVKEIPSIISCEHEPSKVSGQYWLVVPDMPAFEVYCEQTLQGGGWIVIQNRFDGSVDFYRNWTDYKEGFGRLDGEFWLGLDKINLVKNIFLLFQSYLRFVIFQLTSYKTRKLLVHLEDFSGNKKFALYNEFAIGSESEQYVLSTVGGHSGTLVDSFINHRGNKFTTKDVDNDKNSKNCASWFHGAWWYTPGCYTR